MKVINRRSGYICGVDEAGRGPLAGPVYAASVILDSKKPILSLRDSKLLSAKRRMSLYQEIVDSALAWSVASVSATEIDRINILQASLSAMKTAVERMQIEPTQVLVDGLHCPDLSIPTNAIIGGDKKVNEISAASILAKVARDEYMHELHNRFPRYGFAKHKGYPTKEHILAIEKYGITSEHRKSFKPILHYLKKGKRSL